MIIKKGILKFFNSSNYTATIQIAGSGRANLEGVKTSRNIPAVEMIAGRTVAVIFWDKNNPSDAVITGVYV